MSLANGTRVFRHRNYRLYFGGQLVSLVGTWMQAVAQGWLVLQLTGRPVHARRRRGDAVDPGHGARPVRRPDHRLPAQAADADRDPGDQDGPGVRDVRPRRDGPGRGAGRSCVLALLGGLTNVVDMPTRQAFAVEMVGREDIGSAVALNSAMFNAARVLGPAVAGLTIGAFDIATAFLIDAVSFLAVLVALLAMRQSELRVAPLIARPSSAARGLHRAARGPELRAANPARAARHPGRRAGRDVRHELPGGDPAAHRRGAALRRHRLRLPDGGVGRSVRWSPPCTSRSRRARGSA